MQCTPDHTLLKFELDMTSEVFKWLAYNIVLCIPLANCQKNKQKKTGNRGAITHKGGGSVRISTSWVCPGGHINTLGLALHGICIKPTLMGPLQLQCCKIDNVQSCSQVGTAWGMRRGFRSETGVIFLIVAPQGDTKSGVVSGQPVCKIIWKQCHGKDGTWA